MPWSHLCVKPPYEPRITILGIWPGDAWLIRGKYGIYVAVRGSYGPLRGLRDLPIYLLPCLPSGAPEAVLDWGGGGDIKRLTFCVGAHAKPHVASFSVLGGKTPKCTDKNICTYIAQASEASERLKNIYFQDSNTSAYMYNQCSFLQLLLVWRYNRHYTDKTLTLRQIY